MGSGCGDLLHYLVNCCIASAATLLVRLTHADLPRECASADGGAFNLTRRLQQDPNANGPCDRAACPPVWLGGAFDNHAGPVPVPIAWFGDEDVKAAGSAIRPRDNRDSADVFRPHWVLE